MQVLRLFHYVIILLLLCEMSSKYKKFRWQGMRQECVRQISARQWRRWYLCFIVAAECYGRYVYENEKPWKFARSVCGILAIYCEIAGTETSQITNARKWLTNTSTYVCARKKLCSLFIKTDKIRNQSRFQSIIIFLWHNNSVNLESNIFFYK